MPSVDQPVATVSDMESLGSKIAAHLSRASLIYLRGPLGAGKTTLVRGMLRGLGHEGAVKSPTFTLVEPYSFPELEFYHFDLYRLNNPEELEFLGVRDYLHGKGVCVVEWAERAEDVLPTPDVDIMISPTGTGRMVRITAYTDHGKSLLDAVT
ncbi:MAG TPA: tRNA (adenosine(37)-N6)-threonylcarbamoyltransferase complex ATPase subunit type 1 TsaE [Sulfuricaulis sp.]|jgi:tRNA threonylcarbamoyladenosine biosynthesis protein TsaE|nr:tRNA (adenosine(37)-N6)-threonylcarbamoyltransferase complex ATPase subunit type 1 TsaE [Sulfuricaulis sp.]